MNLYTFSRIKSVLNLFFVWMFLFWNKSYQFTNPSMVLDVLLLNHVWGRKLCEKRKLNSGPVSRYPNNPQVMDRRLNVKRNEYKIKLCLLLGIIGHLWLLGCNRRSSFRHLLFCVITQFCIIQLFILHGRLLFTGRRRKSKLIWIDAVH